MKKLFCFLWLCLLVFGTTTFVEAKKFPDVNHQTEMGRAIDFLSDKGVISGFPNGQFKPQERVTRGQAAKMLANITYTNSRYTVDPIYQEFRSPSFTDIPRTHQYFYHIEALVDYGVIGGYEDGTFKQSLHLTRAHIAKMIAYGYMLSQPEPQFDLKDVAVYSERYPYVNAVLSFNIMNETQHHTFSPNEYVTRGEFALFLYRAHQHALEHIALEKRDGTPFIEAASPLGQLLSSHPVMAQTIYTNMNIAAARVTMNRAHYAFDGIHPINTIDGMEYENCSDYLDVMLCYGYTPDNRVQSLYIALNEQDISIRMLEQALNVTFTISAHSEETNDMPYYIGTATINGFNYTFFTDYTPFNPEQLLDHSFETLVIDVQK